jgi:hypothetical protein
MNTLESYAEEIQILLEPICEKLKTLKRLACARTGREIKDEDAIYYDADGVVCENADYRVQALYLGTLSELRAWCRIRLGPHETEIEKKIDLGKIQQFLDPDDLMQITRYLNESMD